jgi:hypothetical protein
MQRPAGIKSNHGHQSTATIGASAGGGAFTGIGRSAADAAEVKVIKDTKPTAKMRRMVHPSSSQFNDI